MNRLRGFWDFFKAFLYYKIVGVSFSLVTELPTHSRQALDEITIEKLQRMVRVSRVTFDEYENVLDWDARIEHPPLRPAGTIQVKLEYKGRSKPIPVTDPWSE
ncbi:MAG: hypothetical protein HY314_06265 [Acidobacteria bacterium]|nr:hypothetical protein [Acidobacteriota bacterium]